MMRKSSAKNTFVLWMCYRVMCYRVMLWNCFTDCLGMRLTLSLCGGAAAVLLH